MSQHGTPAPAVTYGRRAPVIVPMAPVPAVTDTAPVPVSEHVTPAPAVTYGSRAPVIGPMAAVPAVTYTAPAPVNGNVAASEMETAFQEVSDLLASGLGRETPSSMLHGLDLTSWERGRWPRRRPSARSAELSMRICDQIGLRTARQFGVCLHGNPGRRPRRPSNRFGVWDPQENPGHRPENRYLAALRSRPTPFGSGRGVGPDCAVATPLFPVTDNVGRAKKKNPHTQIIHAQIHRIRLSVVCRERPRLKFLISSLSLSLSHLSLSSDLFLLYCCVLFHPSKRLQFPPPL